MAGETIRYGGTPAERQTSNDFHRFSVVGGFLIVNATGGFPGNRFFGQGGEGSAVAPVRGYITQTVDAQGMSEVRASASSSNAFTLEVIGGLQILTAADPPPGYSVLMSVGSAVDPTSGLHVADLVVPVTRKFIRVKVDHGVGNTFGDAFEIYASLLPGS